jgi:hypothetical protein
VVLKFWRELGIAHYAAGAARAAGAAGGEEEVDGLRRGRGGGIWAGKWRRLHGL